MNNPIPVPNVEVRWFLAGDLQQHEPLVQWFSEASVDERSPRSRYREFRARRRSDIYLLIPGGPDIGLKWREGNLQIKARTATSGTHLFADKHTGHVENWTKWSFEGLPAPYRILFESGHDQGLVTVAVIKSRLLRKVSIDTLSGAAEEVDARTPLDRGLYIELSSIEAAEKRYSSLAIEAFPNDSGMSAAFSDVTETLFASLSACTLDARHSKSYPAFLNELMGC